MDVQLSYIVGVVSSLHVALGLLIKHKETIRSGHDRLANIDRR